MEFKDYYKILGVDRAADQKSITSAFRRLARQYHPDVNKDKAAEDRFKEVNEAYQVLGKPESRTRYDQMYEAYQHGGVNWQDLFGRGASPQAPGGWTVTYGSAEDLEDLLGGAGGFSDFFRQFFGGGIPRSATRRARRGPPPPPEAEPRAQSTLDISLEEAYRGAQKALQLHVNGNQRRIEVAIPKGVKSGQTIRLPGALDGRDLYLTVKIQPHPQFERRNDDLYVDAPVSLVDAVLGATITVPTLNGSVEMTIPAETQNGQLFRLRGQGMPRRDGSSGDEFVRVKVVLPGRLTAKERELFEALRKLRATK